MVFPFLFLVIVGAVLQGCGHDKKDQQDPVPDDRIGEVRALYDQMLDDASDLRDKDTGWLARWDCDGMIWAGRYAASPGVDGVDIEAAEVSDHPGRFGRRPPPACWSPDGGDNGSPSDWSRDMAEAGLIPWAWLTKNLRVLENHAAYGKAHNWQMGEPVADGRTVYSPALIGLLYQAIFGLGGEDSVNRIWPGIYPSGQTDYQANLQVTDIWLRGEIAAALQSPGDLPAKPAGLVRVWGPGQLSLSGLDTEATVPREVTEDGGKWRLLSISETMYERLGEQARRMPEDPFYSYAWGLYSGDMTQTIDALTAGTVGDYVRCGDWQAQCVLAHRIFVAGQLLTKYGESP